MAAQNAKYLAASASLNRCANVVIIPAAVSGKISFAAFARVATSNKSIAAGDIALADFAALELAPRNAAPRERRRKPLLALCFERGCAATILHRDMTREAEFRPWPARTYREFGI